MISIRKCWEVCCEPEIPNFFASAVLLHHQLYRSPSECPITECWSPEHPPPNAHLEWMVPAVEANPASQIWTLRSGSHTLGQTCSPEYQYPQKMTRKWLHPEDTWEATAWVQEREAERAALMPHSKGALQSHNTAEQEASTGLQIHCPGKPKKARKS